MANGLNVSSLSTRSIYLMQAFLFCVRKYSLTLLSVFAGYEKTEDGSEKTSLADQEDARLIYISQPQFTKFCNNRVR